MNIYYCDSFVLPLPAQHRFPMAKYRLLRERISAQVEAWQARLLLPEAASTEDLVRVHCPAYVERVRNGSLSEREQRKLGFPWSPQLAERTRRVSGATCAALCSVLDAGRPHSNPEGTGDCGAHARSGRAGRGDGVAVSLAGGTHHAHYEHGAGYCVFNDSVVAARKAQAAGLAQRILIVDLDVHQGDGTASLVRRDPSIYAFSMHAARNYPAVKAISDLDVALPDGTGDSEYLEALARALPLAIEHARADAAIYLAGADPFEGDSLGYLKLSKSGLAARDRFVLDRLHAAGLPVAVTMAGGYASQVEDIVDIHFTTVTIAAEASLRWRNASPGLNGPRTPGNLSKPSRAG